MNLRNKKEGRKAIHFVVIKLSSSVGSWEIIILFFSFDLSETKSPPREGKIEIVKHSFFLSLPTLIRKFGCF